MIIITITLSIVYTLIIIFLLVTWYKDLKQKEDTDKRILVLEKRINEYRQDLTDTMLRYVEELNQATNINDSCILQLAKKIKKLENETKKQSNISKNS